MKRHVAIDDTIYLLTSIRIAGSLATSRGLDNLRVKLMGWYSSLDAARADVLRNASSLDMDGIATHAVIETVPSGIDPRVTAEIWFAFDGIRFSPCDRPAKAADVIDWYTGC